MEAVYRTIKYQAVLREGQSEPLFAACGAVRFVWNELLRGHQAHLLLKVPPQYTSQTCSKCGHVHKDNRKGRQFKCLSCGHTDHADINAAINILMRAFEMKLLNPSDVMGARRVVPSVTQEVSNERGSVVRPDGINDAVGQMRGTCATKRLGVHANSVELVEYVEYPSGISN